MESNINLLVYILQSEIEELNKVLFICSFKS